MSCSQRCVCNIYKHRPCYKQLTNNSIQFSSVQIHKKQRIQVVLFGSAPFKLQPVYNVCTFLCLHTFLSMFFKCNLESNEYYNKAKEVRNIQSEHVLFFMPFHISRFFFSSIALAFLHTHKRTRIYTLYRTQYSTKIINFTLNYANWIYSILFFRLKKNIKQWT